MVSQTNDITTPREWALLDPEVRAARLILDTIDVGVNARDQAVRIWSIYRDYAQSEVAQAAAIAPSGEKVPVRAYSLGASVASVLLDLACEDEVLPETVAVLGKIAALSTSGTTA